MQSTIYPYDPYKDDCFLHKAFLYEYECKCKDSASYAYGKLGS